MAKKIKQNRASLFPKQARIPGKTLQKTLQNRAGNQAADRMASGEAVPLGEAARRMGVDIRTVKKMCTSGRLNYYKTDGGHWRIYVVGIEAFRRGDTSTKRSSNGSHFPSPTLEQKRELVQELRMEFDINKARTALQEQEAEQRAKAEQQKTARLEQEREERRARQEIDAERSRQDSERQRQASRQQWNSYWFSWLRTELHSLPDVPAESRVEITDVVRQELDSCYEELSGHAEDLVEEKLRVAISKVLRPWERSQQAVRRSQQAARAVEQALRHELYPLGQERLLREHGLSAIAALPEPATFEDMQSVAIAAFQEVVRQHREQKDQREREEEAEKYLRRFLIPYLKEREKAANGIDFEGQFDHYAERIKAEIRPRLLQDPRLLNVYFAAQQRVQELAREWLETSLNGPLK